MAAVGRHVQRRQVVQRYIVHRSLVVQQVLHALHMVALRRHVQRRQPVLQRQGRGAGGGKREKPGAETRESNRERRGRSQGGHKGREGGGDGVETRVNQGEGGAGAKPEGSQ